MLSSAYLPRVALADELPTFRLSWVRGDGAEGCIAEKELERAVAARLGRNPFDEGAEQTIEASITRGDQTGWKAQIRVRDPKGNASGKRDLDVESDDCRAIGDAVALAMALAIDPNAELGEAPPPLSVASPNASVAPTAVATGTCPVAPVCKAEAPCSCPPPMQTTTRGTLTGRALLAGGILPGAAYGAAVGGDFVIGRFRSTLAWYWLSESERSGFAFGLSTAAAGACFDAIRSDSMTLGICTAFELGAMHSVVKDPNLVPDGPGEQVWAALELGPRLGWRGPGPLYAELGGSLVVPVTRPEFGVQGEEDARFQPDLAGGLGFVALGVAVP